MHKIRGTKASRSWGLILGVMQLSLLLLVHPDPGSAATTMLDPGNSYFFAVTGYNPEGLDTINFGIVGTDDPAPPAIAIVDSPESFSNNGIVSISVNPPDNVEITKIQLFANGMQIAETATAPFAFSWNTSILAPGDYTVAVKAFDAAGNQEDSADFPVTVAGDVTPPAVSLVTPAGAAASGTVSISASANDNVLVTAVELYLDGNLVLTSNQSPASFSWNTLAESNGSHVLGAKAYDAAGNVGVSSLIELAVFNDTTAPVVSIDAPAANSTVGGTLAVSVSSSDNVGVSRVEFYVNGTLQSTSTGAPYSFTWNTLSVANGGYSIFAKAYDAAGNVGQSATVAVIVFNDTAAPMVSIVSPVTNSSASKSVVVSANASDNVGVSKVEFYLNGSLKATSTGAPYSFTWNTLSIANGAYTLSAKAYDAAGNVGQSATVAVIVFNDTAAPTVSIASPVTSNKVGGTVTVSANASDNVAVTKVDFYLNGALKSTSTVAPYSFTWNTLSVANGAYTLSAKAYDAAGNVGQSGNVAVNVINDTTAPTIAFLSPTSNYVAGSSVRINSSASDNVAVTRMELYIDGSLKFSTAASSFNIGWNFSIGLHTMTVKAYDAANNQKSVSKTVNRFF